MNEMTFTKAERKKSKLRLGISGPSGSGKTYSALLLAKGMGGKIAVIDTERGSASMYTHLVDFDVLELSAPFSPERFRQAVAAAENAGYDICILDSITHEWSGSGGCLEINEELARARYKGNTWSAWNDTTPRHRDFLDTLLQSKMHIIATMRSKTETVQNNDKKVVKLGMKSEQREGSEYEFSIVFELTHDGHFAIAAKDRTDLFKERTFVPSPEVGKELLAWLNSGAELKPEAKKVEAPKEPAKKPEPATLPHNPETGEILPPHTLPYTTAVDFGKVIAAAIQASKTDAELTDWIGQNEVHLKTLETASPKMRQRVTDLEKKQRESFAPKEEEEKVPPAIARQVAEARAAGKM